MLFWISVAVCISGIVLMILSDFEWNLSDWWTVGFVATIVSGLVIVCSLFVIIFNYIGIEADVEANKVRYESLVYQYENSLFDRNGNYGEKTMMQEIQSWNEELAWHKTMQRNLWIGIYIPNVFDDFKYIELRSEPLEADHGE